MEKIFPSERIGISRLSINHFFEPLDVFLIELILFEEFSLALFEQGMSRRVK